MIKIQVRKHGTDNPSYSVRMDDNNLVYGLTDKSTAELAAQVARLVAEKCGESVESGFESQES